MIDASGQRFLKACAERGVDFTRTLMLGRQELPDQSFAEPFFKGLGAATVDSLDASVFEGATIIADLNRPLPANLRQRFSAVYDGGTLEHVFDIATALRSCLDLVAVGGHYIASSPANNWPGHGFYQFSPELVFRTMSSEAGYELRGVFVVEQRRRERWYAIPDPRAIGSRLYWRNSFRTLLVTVARRVKAVDLSSFVPQQSDYVERWKGDETAPGPVGSPGPRGRVKALLWRRSPQAARDVYEVFKRHRLEHFDAGRFARIDVADVARHIQ